MLKVLVKKNYLFTDYQYGYGLPGMPGAFNPFLLNPGWLDAAYLSTYSWSEYFRTRNIALPQQTNVHPPPLVKTTSPQLPTHNLHTTPDFYVHQNGTTSTTFHPPHFLPSNTLLPQFPSTTTPTTTSDNFHNIRPVPPMEQLSLRLSPVSNTQSLSPQQNLTHDSRINSTVDQSNSENEEEEEDEIDVVKSAFHPIKAASLLLQEIQHPDSTVKEEPIKKCELKAPSSKKITTISSQKSPGTKIHTTSTTKNVWRPY